MSEVIYMKVTKDKYELPVAVASTVVKLAVQSITRNPKHKHVKKDIKSPLKLQRHIIFLLSLMQQVAR